MPPPGDNIFTSCKKGLLTHIQYLVEKKEVDLNVRDCWDSTPLYYACHCGHQAVVRYLLENGARCEANTFDGERCLYGALTDSIKKLLLDSKIINSSSKRRDEFDEFCEKLISAKEYSDVTVVAGGKEYNLHYCILSARVPNFNKKLKSQQGIRSTLLISSAVFDEFVKYLYTGRLTCYTKDADYYYNLAVQFGAPKLALFLKKSQRQLQYLELSPSAKKMKISTLIVDTPDSRAHLLYDFGEVLNIGLPDEFVDNPFYRFRTIAGDMEGKSEEEIDPMSDLCLIVNGHRFYCNKLFLCCRSEYFEALCANHFKEYSELNGILSIPLQNVNASVLSCVLNYIYTNSPKSLTDCNVLDVLEVANIYLLPGLKKHCVSHLCRLLTQENIIDGLNLARLHDLPKLEAACAEFIAGNVNDICKMHEFRAFVLRDASEVIGRQETDSIPIIDDIRFHLSNEVGSFSEVKEAQEKLRVIDNLLEDLGLDA